MSTTYRSVLAITAISLVSTFAVLAQDASRSIAGGGISVPGWSGKADTNQQGQTVNDAKLAKEGDAIHFVTGPAVTYWNPANKATGDYTVKATFKEPKFQNLNTHAHPYGIMIGGNDLDTDHASYLYCAAYGNGNFIVRGMGPAPFQMNGRRGMPSAAVNKATAVGEPVQQDIAMSVKGGKIECAINGTVVASYDKAEAIGEGKLKSTDGVYGLRMAHNTEGFVSGLTVTKP
jgi:hypothetical protein